MKQVQVIALAIAVASGLGCKAKSTFVHVTLSPAQPEPSGIKSIELQLALGSQNAVTTLREADGRDIALPADTTLQIGSGTGQLSITAVAKGADGKELDRGVTTATVAAGAITEVGVAMAGGKADLEPSEAHHDFGAISQGQSSGMVNLSFINAGYKPTGTLSAALSGAGAAFFALGTDGCSGHVLAPSASCSVGLTFLPTTAVGPLAAAVTLTGSPGGTATVAVTGTGNAAAEPLAIALAGNGAGAVSSAGNQLNCGASGCNGSFAYGTSITLAAAASTGSVFAGWQGDCTGTGPCTLQMSAGRNVTATFTLIPEQLTVSVRGNGTVLNADKTISCASASSSGCVASFPYGTLVTLQASPMSGFSFTAWANGPCNGSNRPTCQLPMTQAYFVIAQFDVTQYAVTVATPNAGGTVTSQPNGISCDGTCRAQFPVNSTVTLTASANAGYRFGSWTGCTSASGNVCSLTITGDTNVGVTWIQQYTVTVKPPAISGVTVTSSVGGINCTSTGTNCTGLVDAGNDVALNVSTDSTARWTGWTDACASSGTNSCEHFNLSASFVAGVTAVRTYQYSVNIMSGGVTGTVTSSPAGINCPSTSCVASFDTGVAVTLTFTPANQNSRVSFQGAGCSGSGLSGATVTCQFTSAASGSISTTFTDTVPLNLSKVGASASSASLVASAGATFSCLNGCTSGTVNVDVGTSITLQARPVNGSNTLFSGWTGAKCGAGPLVHDCTFTANLAANVSATFAAQNYNTAFISSVPYPSTLGSARKYDDQCNSLATAAGINNTAGNAFFAFMSDDNTDAINQFPAGTLSFTRVDGAPVATSLSELTTGHIHYPIVLDETGFSQLTPLQAQYAFTGSDATGHNYKTGTSPPTSYNCANWTNANASTVALGEIDSGPGLFGPVNGGSAYCQLQQRVYCFEKDKAAVLTLTASPGKMIFVPPNFSLSNSGVAALDNICQMNKPTGSSSTFRAMVATTTAAASRVLTASTNYVTPSGQPLGTGAQIAAGQGSWATGVFQQADGTFANSYNTMLTGAPTPSQVGTRASTCGDWTDTTQTGVLVGQQNETALLWFQSNSRTCTGLSGSVYCVEQ